MFNQDIVLFGWRSKSGYNLLSTSVSAHLNNLALVINFNLKTILALVVG